MTLIILPILYILIPSLGVVYGFYKKDALIVGCGMTLAFIASMMTFWFWWILK